MPEVACPDLGDIGSIIRLIDLTAKGMNVIQKQNEDPDRPGLPRLRMVGHVMVRVAHSTVFRDFLVPSYMAARQLGYRGTYQRWNELVEEARVRL
jgi:hypothetical protein